MTAPGEDELIRAVEANTAVLQALVEAVNTVGQQQNYVTETVKTFMAQMGPMIDQMSSGAGPMGMIGKMLGMRGHANG